MEIIRATPVILLLIVASVSAQERFTLSGLVLDGSDSTTISGARIALSTTGKSIPVSSLHVFAVTPADGRFEFTGIAKRSYILEVSAGGYYSLKDSVELPAGMLTIFLTRKTYKLMPILVTAQLAEVRRSPVTFSDLPDSIIATQMTFQDIPVLLSQLPSVTMYSENGEGIGYSYITMRGFDQQRISIMVNGIPQNDPEDHNVYWIDMPDLLANTQNIQVQRGAGNEFYGAPAIGGSINLETTNSANDHEINFSFGVGSTGSNGTVQRYSTTLSSGLIDNKYSVYAHVAKNITDGYRQDSWVNLDSYFLNATRYDEDITTEVNIYGGPISDGLSYLGLPKFAALDKNLRTQNWDDWNIDSNAVNYSPHMTRFVAGRDTVYAVPRRSAENENFSQPHFELINEWKISPTASFTNSLFAISGSGFYNYDGSWADTSYFRISSAYGFNPEINPTDALIHAYESLEQYGWLPRLSIQHYRGNLVLGAELDRNYSDHWASIEWAQGLPLNLPANYHYNEWHARTDVATVYGHEYYDLDRQLTLMFDLEYEFKQYQFFDEEFVGNKFEVPYHFINPRFGLNYNLSHESSAYLSLSRTSREPPLASIYNADESSGGEVPHFALNRDSTLNFGDPLVHPESLSDFEIGYHYNKGDVNLGVTGYWMEFNNELVSNGVLDQYGQPVDGNATKTRHIGIELELSTSLTDYLYLYGNVAVSRNKIIRYTYYESQTDSSGNAFTTSYNLDGNTIGGFPEVLGNVRATLAFGRFSFVLLGQYVGSQYTDNFQSSLDEIDPYFVLNGWLSFEIENFSPVPSITFKLYGNNLLNRIYIAHGEGQFFFPAATRTVFLNCSVNL